MSDVVKLLTKLEATGSTLLVVDQKHDLLERATRNLQDVMTVRATYLNVFDVLNADGIVISQTALEQVSSWLGVAKKPAAKKEEQ